MVTKYLEYDSSQQTLFWNVMYSIILLYCNFSVHLIYLGNETVILCWENLKKNYGQWEHKI